MIMIILHILENSVISFKVKIKLRYKVPQKIDEKNK